MAIIVPENDTRESDRGSLEAVIFVSSRPAYLTLDGSVAGELAQPWKERFTANRSRLEQAIRATARVRYRRRGDRVHWNGIRRWAQTCRHRAACCALAIGQFHGRKPGRQDQGRLSPQLSVRAWFEGKFECPDPKREADHPFFDFALLELGEEVEEKRWIRLSAVAPSDIVNREICVIGYPSLDPRNDKALMDRIFGSVYGVKRVMPGHVISLSDGAAVNKPSALVHDASTLGGTGGVPLSISIPARRLV